MNSLQILSEMPDKKNDEKLIYSLCIVFQYRKLSKTQKSTSHCFSGRQKFWTTFSNNPFQALPVFLLLNIVHRQEIPETSETAETPSFCYCDSEKRKILNTSSDTQLWFTKTFTPNKGAASIVTGSHLSYFLSIIFPIGEQSDQKFQFFVFLILRKSRKLRFSYLLASSKSYMRALNADTQPQRKNTKSLASGFLYPGSLKYF